MGGCRGRSAVEAKSPPSSGWFGDTSLLNSLLVFWRQGNRSLNSPMTPELSDSSHKEGWLGHRVCAAGGVGWLSHASGAALPECVFSSAVQSPGCLGEHADLAGVFWHLLNHLAHHSYCSRYERTGQCY